MAEPRVPPRAFFSRLPQFAQNVAFTLGAQVVSVTIAILYNVLIARATGPEGKGIYSLAILAPMLLSTFTAFNMGAGTTYYIGNRKYTPGLLMGNVFSLCALLTLVFGALYLAFLPEISRFAFKGLSTDYLLLSFFIYPAVMLGIPFSGAILGSQRIKTASTIDLLRSFLTLALVAVLLLAFQSGIKGAIAATATSFWAALLASWLYSRRLEKLTISFSPRMIRDILTYSAKGFVGSVIQLLNYRLDIFLINFFMTPVNVGIYSVSVMIAETIWYIPNAVGYVLFPKISASDARTADRITPQVSRITLALTIAAGAGLLLLAPHLIGFLFGEQFSGAAAPAAMLIPGVIALGITKVLGNDLAARGKPEYPALTSAVALLLSAGTSIAAIPAYGIAGAAIATSLSYCASGITISVLYWRHTGNHPWSFLVPGKQDFILLKNAVSGSLNNA
ncbi:MAG: oligosaccharide flippase family protein [Elusimicrobia bacterium]|nr:oligosaccharide flippase family protein [Elusimicrobiota bacterium]